MFGISDMQICLREKIRSLRTQQRAYAVGVVNESFRQPEGCCTDSPTFASCELVSVPPLSSTAFLAQPFGYASASRPGRSLKTARCSLERR